MSSVFVYLAVATPYVSCTLFKSVKYDAMLEEVSHECHVSSRSQPESAHALAAWRYPAPYDTYNIGDEAAALAEMLDSRSPWFVALDTNDAITSRWAIAASARRPRSAGRASRASGRRTTGTVTLSVGLGLRPDLTGQQLGLPFFEPCWPLRWSDSRPDAFRLFVLPFNQRAIRVYERAGFRHVGTLDAPDTGSDARLFLEMRREVGQKSAGKSEQ